MVKILIALSFSFSGIAGSFYTEDMTIIRTDDDVHIQSHDGHIYVCDPGSSYDIGDMVKVTMSSMGTMSPEDDIILSID